MKATKAILIEQFFLEAPLSERKKAEEFISQDEIRVISRVPIVKNDEVVGLRWKLVIERDPSISPIFGCISSTMVRNYLYGIS